MGPESVVVVTTVVAVVGTVVTTPPVVPVGTVVDCVDSVGPGTMDNVGAEPLVVVVTSVVDDV